MPDTQPTDAIDRIPLTHSVCYAVRGLPEVPNQYGPGTLAPSEITLTYRTSPDSQLDRIHAYVAGRLYSDGKEIPLLPGGLYGQHYDDGVGDWPECLAQEARLHDPAAPTAPADATHGLSVQHADALWDAVAIPGPTAPTFPMQHERVCRAVAEILDEVAVAQTVVPVSSPPPDQTPTLRDRIAEAVRETVTRIADLRSFDTQIAAAVLAVLPPPADRAAVLKDFLWRLEQSAGDAAAEKFLDDNPELGRLAAEAQQQAPWATDSARIGRVLIWSHADIGNGDFGRGYRAAQEEARAILTRPLCGAEAQQPDTETRLPAEDPARIDRLRPEFTDHASVESIDAQLKRARAQERRWHLRTERLIGLRQARVEQKARGEWPATTPEPPPVHKGGNADDCPGGEQASDTDRIVAYRMPVSNNLYCVPCCGTTDRATPLTTGDLPDGGLCVGCGVDVLIPQDHDRV